jgi:hypothetical protein
MNSERAKNAYAFFFCLGSLTLDNQKTFFVCSFFPNASRSEEMRKTHFEDEKNSAGILRSGVLIRLHRVPDDLRQDVEDLRSSKNLRFFSSLKSADFRDSPLSGPDRPSGRQRRSAFSWFKFYNFHQDKERQEQDACADERERECGDSGEPEPGRDRDVGREQGGQSCDGRRTFQVLLLSQV